MRIFFVAVKLRLEQSWGVKEETGQDLIEYALVVALISFAAIAAMNSLATGINTAFANVATTLASST
jgi:pilus assembly protein Flp/PilA